MACGFLGAAYADFFLVLVNPNKVVSWGNNEYGQLGYGKVNKRNTKKPKTIPGLKNIKAVATGSTHSLVLDYQGKVYGFGRNNYGQLGLGKGIEIVPVPTLIPGLEKITAIFAKYNLSFALDKQGNLYEFGWSVYYPTVIQFIPQLVPITKVVTMSIGRDYCLYLNSSGLVYGSGKNSTGQLGLVDKHSTYPISLIQHLEDIVSVFAAPSRSYFLNSKGMVYILGNLGEIQLSEDTQTYFPALISGLSNIISVTTIDYYVLCLNNKGELWSVSNYRLDEMALLTREVIAIQDYPLPPSTLLMYSPALIMRKSGQIELYSKEGTQDKFLQVDVY
jgi:alpha-tubulin suppressor-like RCC1 family protein